MQSTSNQWSEQLLMQLAGLESQTLPNSALYIVGLPIGNAADITLRALWVLTSADVIAAEDTRETKKLLERFSISVPTVSVREHNEIAQSHMIIERLQKGEKVAMVTDAGTPAVSDPGARLVREVLKAGFRVIPIPGASAVITALSAAGLEPAGFQFVGFLPPQAKARREALSALLGQKGSFVLYEAPHRIKEVLKDLGELSQPERRVVVARELTKKFETFCVMSAQELSEWLQSYEPKGEYVILVDVAPESDLLELSQKDKQWIRVLASAVPSSKAAAAAAKIIGCSRDDIYKWLLMEKNAD
jgi:16S rRNA (cytidine1402-2'-O)-methyltransferase